MLITGRKKIAKAKKYKLTFWKQTKPHSKFWKWLRKNPKARGLY